MLDEQNLIDDLPDWKPYFMLKVQLKLHLDNTEIIKLQKLKLLIQFSYFMTATKQIDQF